MHNIEEIGIPGKLVNKTPCLYLCSFPFVVAALLLVGSLASLAWILTYPTVMIQIQTRSLIHQFSRYPGALVGDLSHWIAFANNQTTGTVVYRAPTNRPN